MEKLSWYSHKLQNFSPAKPFTFTVFLVSVELRQNINNKSFY